MMYHISSGFYTVQVLNDVICSVPSALQYTVVYVPRPIISLGKLGPFVFIWQSSMYIMGTIPTMLGPQNRARTIAPQYRARSSRTKWLSLYSKYVSAKIHRSNFIILVTENVVTSSCRFGLHFSRHLISYRAFTNGGMGKDTTSS